MVFHNQHEIWLSIHFSEYSVKLFLLEKKFKAPNDVENTLPFSGVDHLKVKIHPKKICKKTFTSATEKTSVVVNAVLLRDTKYTSFKI